MGANSGVGAYLSKWVFGEGAYLGGGLFGSGGLFDHLRYANNELSKILLIKQNSSQLYGLHLSKIDPGRVF